MISDLIRYLLMFCSWRQYFEPLRAQGKKLVAPAITSSNNQGQGLSWLDQFIDACSGCHFDAYAFRPYASDAAAVKGSVDYFIKYKSECLRFFSS